MPDLNCGLQDLYLWHVRPSSLIRDWTWAPQHWEHGVLATGPPEKSLHVSSQWNWQWAHPVQKLSGLTCSHQTPPNSTPHFYSYPSLHCPDSYDLKDGVPRSFLIPPKKNRERENLESNRVQCQMLTSGKKNVQYTAYFVMAWFHFSLLSSVFGGCKSSPRWAVDLKNQWFWLSIWTLIFEWN